jgi:hypothetical protein
MGPRKGASMKIRTEHQNLGAALMQIAEDDNFTAINPLRLKGEKINNAFLINADTCLFLKYGQEPKGAAEEYKFTFSPEVLDSIELSTEFYKKIFIGLVCVEGQEICCIDMEQMTEMLKARIKSAGQEEETYQVLVTVPEGKSLRAYTNASGRKGVIAGKEKVISRSRFPSCLFG